VAVAEAVLKLLTLAARSSNAVRREGPIREKIETIAKEIYGAGGVRSPPAERALEQLPPWAWARPRSAWRSRNTSFSDDPAKLGAPSGFTLRSGHLPRRRGVRRGAGGRHHDMPGLSKTPRPKGSGCTRRNDRGTILMARKALGTVVTENARRRSAPTVRRVWSTDGVHGRADRRSIPRRAASWARPRRRRPSKCSRTSGYPQGRGLRIRPGREDYRVSRRHGRFFGDERGVREVLPDTQPARSTIQAAALPRRRG